MFRFLWHKNWRKTICAASEDFFTELDSSTKVRSGCWDETTAYGHPECHSGTRSHGAGLNVWFFLIIKSCEFNISEKKHVFQLLFFLAGNIIVVLREKAA